MSEKTEPKRSQVLALLAEGCYTREEMAEKLKMSVASVNSQFTYLRWMSKFIKYDENKKLSLCTEEEFNAWEASKKTSTKASTAKAKTPQEQYATMKKTLETDTKNMLAWNTKYDQVRVAAQEDTENEELQDTYAEAAAMCTLLKLKVKRLTKKISETPVPEPEVVTPEAIIEDLDLNEETDATDQDII